MLHKKLFFCTPLKQRSGRNHHVMRWIVWLSDRLICNFWNHSNSWTTYPLTHKPNVQKVRSKTLRLEKNTRLLRVHHTLSWSCCPIPLVKFVNVSRRMLLVLVLVVFVLWRLPRLIHPLVNGSWSVYWLSWIHHVPIPNKPSRMRTDMVYKSRWLPVITC